jgi:hypothetical protein
MSNALFAPQRAANGDAIFNPQIIVVTNLAAALTVTPNLSAQVRNSVTYLAANLQARANLASTLNSSVTYLGSTLRGSSSLNATLKDSIQRIATVLSVHPTLTASLAQPAVLRATLQVVPGLTANLVVPIGLSTQLISSAAMSASLQTTASTGLPRGLRVIARPTGGAESQLVRFRGDNYADEFEVILERDGEPVSINGCTFVMSVASDKNPSATDPLVYQVFGQVTDAVDGLVEFAPTASQTDMTGFYYYDVQMQDSSGIIRTLISDSYVFKPDITR